MNETNARRLAELRRDYARALPERLAAVHAQWQTLAQNGIEDAACLALMRILHGLSGSGGSYGCDSLSEAARRLEEVLKSMTSDHWAGEGRNETKRLLAVVELAIHKCCERLNTPENRHPEPK